jgi:Spy/CpxP family protein refolding chaperone
VKFSRISIALQLLLVFVCGAAVGGFGHRFYISRAIPAPAPSAAKKTGDPVSFRNRYIGEMRSRLNLSGAQVDKLNQIMDASRAKVTDWRKRSDQEMKEVQEDQQTKIRALLDQTQAAEYEKMLAERERERQQRRQRPPDPNKK